MEIEDNLENEPKDEQLPDETFEGVQDAQAQEDEHHIIPLKGMFENWFLDYASYVILERAVPAIEDGLKPVQRRILPLQQGGQHRGQHHEIPSAW